MSEICKQYKVGEFTVQFNGIVRDNSGVIVGRLEDLKKPSGCKAVSVLKRARPEPETPRLRKMVTDVINRCSAENESNTPDFILAEFLMSCLDSFDKATNKRTRWYYEGGGGE